jgi:vacuolar-type H+-ATPase subunit E/Vma4
MAENIVDQILDAARTAGEETLAAAQQRYESDMQAGRSALERDVDELRRRGRRQAEEAAQQELSTARLEQRRRQANEKRRLLDDAYEQAWQQITEEAAYRAWLQRQLGVHAQRGDVVVVAARERERFQGSFAGVLEEHGVTLSDEAGRFRAGFVIDRGETRLNCTLDEEFRALSAEAEIEISAALFAGDKG